MKVALDINCDCGESFGNWKMGTDEELLPHLTTANVACGFHAGDPVTMMRTVRIAKEHGVVVGSHPGLPDLLGFGRRRMEITRDEAYSYILCQSGALRSMLEAHGMTLHHVKLHGALYAMLSEDEELSDAAAQAIIEVCPDRILYWPAPTSVSALPRVAAARGIQVVGEVYVDLDYDAKGKLILQRQKVLVDRDHVRGRVREFLTTGKVTCVTGETVAMDAESICVHGDGPNALEVVQAVREEASKLNVVIAPISKTAVSEPMARAT
jgi:UPF0271 protein